MKARKVCNGALFYYNIENGQIVDTTNQIDRLGVLRTKEGISVASVESFRVNKGRQYYTYLVDKDFPKVNTENPTPFGLSHTSLEAAGETILNLVQFLIELSR